MQKIITWFLVKFNYFLDEQKCEPGRQFLLKCNACHCTPDGKIGACTKMACNGWDGPSVPVYVDDGKPIDGDGMSNSYIFFIIIC